MLFFIPQLNAVGITGNEPEELFNYSDEIVSVAYDGYEAIPDTELSNRLSKNKAFLVTLINLTNERISHGYLVEKSNLKKKHGKVPAEKMWISLEKKDNEKYWYFFSLYEIYRLK